MISSGVSLPDELWSTELKDQDGHTTTLDERVRGTPALLVFLRHFGCTGCSQQVDALAPHLAHLADLGIQTLLIGNGAPHFIAGFVSRHALDDYPLLLLSDPTLRIYRLVGLERSVWRTLGPVALGHELSARGRGYFSTDKEGDVLQQGGVVVIDGEGVVHFAEAAEYAAKPVDAARIVEAAVRVAALHGARKAQVA